MNAREGRAKIDPMFGKCNHCVTVVNVPAGGADNSELLDTLEEVLETMSRFSEKIDAIEAKIDALTTAEASEDVFAGTQAAKITALEAQIADLEARETLSDADVSRLEGLTARLDAIRAGEGATVPEPTPVEEPPVA